jgi:hypothetical protein
MHSFADLLFSKCFQFFARQSFIEMERGRFMLRFDSSVADPSKSFPM